MEEYYHCEHVCLSRAKGFYSKEPVPTCTRYHANYNNDDLRGTYERCCDVAITGRCLIPGAEEVEKQKIRLAAEERQKERDKRKNNLKFI